MDPVAGELAEAVIGVLFIAIAAASIVAAISARPRRDAAVFWFGIFAFLYGVRLNVQSSLVAAATGAPADGFEYVEAFLTYTILIPAGLFAEALSGVGPYRMVRRTWQASCVYAAGAIVNDVLRGHHSTMWLNRIVVVLSVCVLLVHTGLAGRGRAWTREARAVAAGAALFTAVAVYETVFDRGVLGAGVDGEPLAMLIFTAALGWLVLARARAQSYAYVALSRELDLAREIQRSLLPSRVPDVPGLCLHASFLPMSAVGGDFYDVLARPDGRLVVIVADVSGHGVPAALVASMVKIAFAAESERYERPGDILSGINRTLTGKFERAYVTACCAVIDRADRSLTYAAAGHPPALLRRGDGRIERLEQAGIVLTFMPDATYADASVPFSPGDQLFLFTDGLLEAGHRDDGDRFFGDAELAKVISATEAGPSSATSVLQAHRDWIGERAVLADDVTLVVVECVETVGIPAWPGIAV
jgi:sigma-B regulation protein RsbU (phosphoserine phosphatase)